MSEGATTEVAPIGVCSRHPGVDAPYVCSRCGLSACINCCFTLDDGSVCCSTCLEPAPAPVVAPSAPKPPALSPVKIGLKVKKDEPGAKGSAPVKPPPGAGCVQHPDVPVVAFCDLCRKGSCAVCDFVFDGDLHYCPACVVTNQEGLSPRKKKFLIASFVLAALSSLGFVATFVILAMMGENSAGAEAAATVLFLVLVLVPSITGAALGVSCFRKGGTPWSVWVAAGWNFLVLGTLLLLAVIGHFAG